MKPILYGYLQMRLDTPPTQIEQGRQTLAAFAARNGFRLGTVFVEQNVNKPCSALTELIAVARSSDWAVVAVARPEDLGRLPMVRQSTRDLVERETGVRVLVVDGAR